MRVWYNANHFLWCDRAWQKYRKVFSFWLLCVTKTTESLCFCAVVRDKNNWELFIVTVQTLPSDMACHVLTEMSPGGSLMSTTSETSMQRKYEISANFE